MIYYDIGYLDGRNHILHLVSGFIQESLSKGGEQDRLLSILTDEELLATALQTYDPGFFNNYDENIGPIDTGHSKRPVTYMTGMTGHIQIFFMDLPYIDILVCRESMSHGATGLITALNRNNLNWKIFYRNTKQ